MSTPTITPHAPANAPHPSRIVVEFRAKLHTVDGTRRVRIPALTPRHVIQGDRLYVTAGSVAGRAELLHLTETLAPLDRPRLTHVSGEFVGTFRIDLGTHAAYREAREHKSTETRHWYATAPTDRTEGLLEMEERVHADVLAIFARHDAAEGVTL